MGCSASSAIVQPPPSDASAIYLRGLEISRRAIARAHRDSPGGTIHDAIAQSHCLEAPSTDFPVGHICKVAQLSHLKTSSVANSNISRKQSDGCDEFHSKYLLGVKLGAGAFAQVRVGVRANDECAEEVAVKIINLKKAFVPVEEQEKAVKYAHIEEKMWKSVGRHRNCVNLFEVFHGSVCSYMVMEKCSSSLLRHIYYMPHINELTLGHLFRGMLHGLAHVHSLRMVHRDVKPDNYMIGEDGRTVKLCDFGLSKKLNRSGKMSGIAGTAPYMCPEMIQGRDYDGRADVWSVGVIVYAFLFGALPYTPKERTRDAMMEAIFVGVRPNFEAVGFRTENALSFVKALLARDMELRPTAAKALKMKFMEDIVDNFHLRPMVQLPSLRPMVQAAVKCGAVIIPNFHRQENDEDDAEMDCILNDLHTKKWGFSVIDTKDHGFVAIPSHSTPAIKSNCCKGATEVGRGTCSDIALAECSTSCSSGSSSRQATAEEPEWSKEFSHFTL